MNLEELKKLFYFMDTAPSLESTIFYTNQQFGEL